jgi:glycosyltransferase involved in cell wall biosynthesis
MKKLSSLSFVIPVYNEGKNIGSFVANSLKIIPQLSRIFEIIIVDDGSTDDSFEVVNSFVNNKDELKVIRHHKNLGSGAAMWTGFLTAKYQYVFYTDADSQFDISDLKLLIPYVQDYDIVLGYRVSRKDNLFRKVISRLWNFIINMIFGLKIKDINCAFKLFNHKVISSISVKSQGAFTNTEILVKAKKCGYKWVEIGVFHYPRRYGRQTGGELKVLLKCFYELAKYYKYLN